MRYAARAQPPDWLSDRHDQTSTIPVSIDFPPTPQALWATRRVLRSVLEVCGWGSATSELDASEAVTNALIHGLPPVRLRLWTGPDRIVATVTDGGDGPADPFVGLLPVTDTCSAGLGLWLTHQLCSHVTLDTTDDGFTIRLIVETPQPGRSGHAPDTA